FSRTAQPRKNDQLISRDIHINILQIIFIRPPDPNVLTGVHFLSHCISFLISILLSVINPCHSAFSSDRSACHAALQPLRNSALRLPSSSALSDQRSAFPVLFCS